MQLMSLAGKHLPSRVLRPLTGASCGTLIAAAIILCGAVPSAGAQLPALQISGRIGLAVPSDHYQSNCGHSSIAYSADVQGRGTIFPHFSVEHLSGSGGGDVACAFVPPADPNVPPVSWMAEGGLRLEGATRASIGGGVRFGDRYVQLEGVVMGGFTTGRYGYDDRRNPSSSRPTLPQVGGQVSLVLFRHLVASWAVHHTRLSLTLTPDNGGPTTTLREWAPMSTVQLGLRLPLGGS